MLEIRYDKTTKRLTGWCGDEGQFGNLKNRRNEVIVVLDIPVPPNDPRAWLFSSGKLIPNPSYTEPEPARNPLTEIAKIKTRLEKLEVKIK